MNKPWLKNYPQGVDENIDLSQYSSVLDILEQGIEKFADRPSYSNFGHSISYAELGQLSEQFACYLQDQLKLKKGDRIAIMLPNVIQYPVAVFAAIRLGLVIVNIDPMYTQRELKLQLNDSQADTLIVLENFASEVEKALPSVPLKNVIVTKIGDCLPTVKGWVLNNTLKHIKKAIPAYNIRQSIDFKAAVNYKGGALVRAELNHDDLLFLQYTGGTTGVPKGVELTHGNIVANILQTTQWMSPVLDGDNVRVISPLPMYHIFCMSASVLSAPIFGYESVLITNPKDFKGFVKFLQKQPFTGIIGVNTLYRKLMDTEGFEKINFSELRFSFAGGMAVTSDVAQEWQQHTGTTIIEGYGLSETSPVVSIGSLTSKEFTGSIGMPVPSTDVKFLDDDDNEVGVGEIGELCIKGPQVMRGYWKRDDATQEVFTSDGYFRTGDYAKMDEQGNLYIMDRKKDMILVSGFNVFPNEIEDVVNQHPSIIESAAIGIDNREAGQVVKLFAVKSDPQLDEEQLLSYCKEHLTGYKRPKEITFVDDLPKSNVGKVLRKELR